MMQLAQAGRHCMPFSNGIHRPFTVQAYQGNTFIGTIFMLDENGTPVSIWYSDSDVTIQGSHKSSGETSTYDITFRKGWNFRYQISTGSPTLYNTKPQSGRQIGYLFLP